MVRSNRLYGSQLADGKVKRNRARWVFECLETSSFIVTCRKRSEPDRVPSIQEFRRAPQQVAVRILTLLTNYSHGKIPRKIHRQTR